MSAFNKGGSSLLGTFYWRPRGSVRNAWPTSSGRSPAAAAATSPLAAAAPEAPWATPVPAEPARRGGQRCGPGATRLSPGVSAQGPWGQCVWMSFWDVFEVFLDGSGLIFQLFFSVWFCDVSRICSWVFAGRKHPSWLRQTIVSVFWKCSCSC